MEALLEFTAALTYLEMLSPFTLSWQPVGLKTQYMQSLCDWFEGPRRKGPLRKPSSQPQKQGSMLSPALDATPHPIFKGGLWPSLEFYNEKLSNISY